MFLKEGGKFYMGELAFYGMTWWSLRNHEFSSGKTDKYGYLTGKEILLSNQSEIIEIAKFAYFPLRKVFEKQTCL